jgi:hypothetical protein
MTGGIAWLLLTIRDCIRNFPNTLYSQNTCLILHSRFPVFALFCKSSALAKGRTVVRAVLPNIYRQDLEKQENETLRAPVVSCDHGSAVEVVFL